jgi:hypothetical protein
MPSWGGRISRVVQVQGERTLPADVQVALYRLCQEALNNIAKHAAASEVAINLQLGTAGVEIDISDDGRGFDPVVATSGHHGLQIMRERAGAIDAVLSIESRPGARYASLHSLAVDGRCEGRMTLKNPIRVMLVDDHTMVRRGLATFLKVYDDLELVGEAANGEAALQLCARVLPDVILMDMVHAGNGWGVNHTPDPQQIPGCASDRADQL